MIAQVVRNELGDDWTPENPDISELSESDEPAVATIDDLIDDQRGDGQTVAQHESGAEIHVNYVDDSWLVNVTIPVESDGLRAYPIALAEGFEDEQHAAGYVRTVGDQISSGEEDLEAFAVVSHTGDIDDVDTSELREHNERATDEDGLPVKELADVFVVRPSTLPDRIDVDDIYDERTAMVDVVYGVTQDTPDIVQEIANESEAYDSVSIEVFTVSAPDLEPISS